MADLPIPTTPPVPAALARPAANSALRGSGAHTPNPFQSVLAQELGQLPENQALPGFGLSIAAAKPDATADAGLAPGDDAAQIAAAGDAALPAACAVLIPFPPALAGAPVSPQAAAGNAPSPAGGTPIGTSPASLALDPRQLQLAQAAVAAKAESRLPAAAPGAADSAAAGKFLRAAAIESKEASAAQRTGLQMPVASAAPDAAPAGVFPPAVAGEIRREAAFDARLLEQHQAAPAPAAAMHAGGAAPVQAAPAPAAALDARVGERGWDQGLGEKLVWMAGQKQQVAELHLNPPDLGPLKITLTLNHDQASAQFVSAHAPVREAIEAAMPRLREMLADSGITLGNASVSTDAFREPAQQQHEPRAYPAAPAAASADAGAVTRGEHLLRRAHGLVDTFA